MKLENGILWCDATTNAVTGCDKVSPGCKNCYAEAGTRARVLRSQGKETWGPRGLREPVNFEPVFRRLDKLCICDRCHETYPVEWLKQKVAEDNHDRLARCGACGGSLRRIRLFADSNSDWLDPKWPVETLAKFLDAIRLAPNVDIQILTKRIELFYDRMEEVLVTTTEELQRWVQKWMDGQVVPSNVWLGVSVEDQKRADERIPLLLTTPAAVRFLSVEPLLDEITFHSRPCIPSEGGFTAVNEWLEKIDWVIVGAESGAKRRDCGVAAIVDVIQQCQRANIPVYVKQDCAFMPGQQWRIPDELWARKEFPRL